MRIKEICLERDLKLDEVNFKKALKHAAVAGAFGAGILSAPNKISTPSIHSHTADSEVTFPASVDTAKNIPAIKPDFIPAPDVTDEPVKIASTNPPGVHPAFPEKLVKQPKISGQHRVENFVDHFLPLIDGVNDRILKNRRRLIGLVRNEYTWTEMDNKWLQYQMEKYQTDSVHELLKRMDIIPRSMALAQAAVESGWGTSDLARKGNAFYGQKAWTSQGSIAGSPGERYSAFSSPSDSVASYAHNLNTHPAYEGFRQQRQELRKKQKSLSGFSLIGHLGKYSTKGPEYIKYVKNMMSIPQLKNLDDTQ